MTMSEHAPLLPVFDRPRATLREKINATVFSSYSNILLLFVPIGIVAGEMGVEQSWVFLFNFLAIIPLAAILSFATEELAEYTGQTVGGLLNATFGNAVELILSIVALRKGQIRLVQASMLGSILSNLLLVLGSCFLAGGFNRIQQKFNQTIAQTMSSLMCLTVCSLLIPAVLHATAPTKNDQEVLALSRYVSVILLVTYVLYLIFQLRTHAAYFDECMEANGASEDEGPPNTTLSPFEALFVLGLVTLGVSFCTDYLVDAIDPVVNATGMSKTFIGVILLPIIGNAVEHVTAIIVAYKDKMDLAIGVAVGSSMQIGLFLTPFLVIMGWVIDQPMSLYFSTFETAILFVSVFIANSLVLDGESNWLEGVILIGCYLICGISFLYFPEPTEYFKPFYH